MVFTFIRNRSPASVGVNMLMKSFTHTTDESFVRSPSGEVIQCWLNTLTLPTDRPVPAPDWDTIERPTPTPVGEEHTATFPEPI